MSHFLYRLSAIGARLPTRWSHRHPFEIHTNQSGETRYIDYSLPGASCLETPSLVITAMIMDAEYYPPEKYTDVLIIEASTVEAGPGCWPAVVEGDVLRMWRLSAEGLAEAAIALLDPEGDDIKNTIDLLEHIIALDTEMVRGWPEGLEAVNKRLHEWLMTQAERVPFSFIDTLQDVPPVLR